MTDYFKFSEKELIDKASKGDSKAFEQLILENQERVRGWILSFTKKPELVDDVFQIACHKAWKNVSKFRDECKFSTWLCTIARNTFYDFYRAVQRRPELSFDEMLHKQVEKGCPVEFKCFGFTEHPRSRDQDSDYYVSLINNAIQKLDEKHREPLTLFLNEGLEYTEIAKKLNCPVGTVMSRIFYARKKALKLLMPLKNELATK